MISSVDDASPTAMNGALAELVRQRQREKWLEENKAAIDRYNSRVRKRGVFSDGLRSF